LDLIKELYPLRTCNYDLSANNIESGKFKVCLEYHIGNCKGPCEGYETIAEYQKQVDAIREILKGNFKESMKDFKRLMVELAQEMRFEEAQKIKEKIEILENYQY
jgi:excinuclease ABC subunit C